MLAFCRSKVFSDLFKAVEIKYESTVTAVSALCHIRLYQDSLCIPLRHSCSIVNSMQRKKSICM